MKTTNRIVRGWRVLALAGLAACGGSQPARETNIGGNESTPTVEVTPSGPTAEELEARRIANTRDAFVRAVQLYRSRPEGQRDLATIRDLFTQAATNGELARDARFNLGLVTWEQGDAAGAEAIFRELTAEDETFAAGLANIAFIHMAQQDFRGAKSVIDECIARRETEAGCNINLAVLYALGEAQPPSGTSSTDAQIERLRFALGGDGANADAYARLSKIYYEQGQLQLARLVCENAVLLGIDQAVLHNRLGLIDLREDDVISAYGEFRRAVELDAGLTEAWVNLGAMALSFRDYDTAVRAFSQVLAQRPTDLEVRLSYGAALRGIEDLDGAEREYRAVLEQRPSDPGALFNLALLYQEGRQDYPEACRQYGRFLAANGSSGELGADVARRRTNLRQLLDSLVFLGEATPEDAAACAD